MKKLLILTSLVAICATSHGQVGASVGTPSKPSTPAAPKKAAHTASWIDSITVAPVAALKTEHLDGPSQWGAGLDVGYQLNPTVSLHIVNLGFEGLGQSTVSTRDKKGKHTGTKQVGEDVWHGPAIDETDVQIDAKLNYLSKAKFSLHLVAGAQTDWNDNDYGVNVGLKAVYDFNKTVGLRVGYDLRTWLKGETRVDSLASASLVFRL